MVKLFLFQIERAAGLIQSFKCSSECFTRGSSPFAIDNLNKNDTNVCTQRIVMVGLLNSSVDHEEKFQLNSNLSGLVSNIFFRARMTYVDKKGYCTFNNVIF